MDASEKTTPEDVNKLINDFIKRNSLSVVSKIDKSTDKEIIFTIVYNLKSKGAWINDLWLLQRK